MAEHRHKRETPASRLPRTPLLAAPLAALATLGVVGVGVLGADVPAAPEASLAGAAYTAVDLGDRSPVLSRSAERRLEEKVQGEMDTQTPELAAELAAAEAAAVTDRVVRRAKKVRTKLWTTAPLNIWSSPDADAKLLGEFEEGKKVLITGRRENDRLEVVIKGVSRWVASGYLTDEKPLGVGAGLSMAPCPDGSVENGLTANAVLVYRSVCHAFPQITSYGGWDGHGEHSSGRALDIMTSDVALGTAIADYLRSHAAELHLYDVIWRQRIWTQERAGEGWRPMSSRGSATANHYDHVHVATY